ncbi:MAG: hypothetical protein ACK56F_08450, partial [bacterium]
MTAIPIASMTQEEKDDLMLQLHRSRNRVQKYGHRKRRVHTSAPMARGGMPIQHIAGAGYAIPTPQPGGWSPHYQMSVHGPQQQPPATVAAAAAVSGQVVA